MSRPISIRISILSSFFIVIGIIAASLLGLQYYFSQELAMSAAHKSFTQTAHTITQYLESRDAFSKNILNLAEQYPDLLLTPSSHKNPKTIKRFAHIIQKTPTIYAMYIGHKNGDLFEVINMQLSTKLYKHFKAPANTRWTSIRIFQDNVNKGGKSTRLFDFYNKDFTLIHSRSDQLVYQANKRPWFTQALHSKQAVRTEPYLFTNLQQKGITFAKKLYNSDAVIAIDITLAQLNKVLRLQKIDPSNELFLLDKKGQIISSSQDNLTQTSAKQNLQNFLIRIIETNKTGQVLHYQTTDSISKKTTNKLIMLNTFSTEFSSDTNIAMSIDAQVILKPYMDKILYSMIIAFICLILAIPLTLYMTSHIVKPIKLLMQQNHKIKARDFSKVKFINSNIIELNDLSNSLVSMSKSIQEYQQAQQHLMYSFIHLIAQTIDEKSAYTGGHCQRVPKIAMMLANEVSNIKEGLFSQFTLATEDEWREFEMGALLHDCGKVTTPEYVVDKATKLETIYNRIHEIRTRFEVLWRDIEIRYYQKLINNKNHDSIERWRKKAQQQLHDDYAFICATNIGGEFMSDEKKLRLQNIAKQTWQRHFDDRIGLSEIEKLRYKNTSPQTLPVTEQLLDDKEEHLVERLNFDQQSYQELGFKVEVPEHLYNYGELYNLSIERGTLSKEERFKINEHVIMTIKMLELLPFPENMQKIPEYAGTHHETMNHTGYPRKLGREQLSIPARIMAIADIFEALTASDRPYKKGKTLSEAIRIMGFMKQEQHIDGDLFDIFVQSGVYKDYAKKYLKPEQIDS